MRLNQSSLTDEHIYSNSL